MLFILVSSRIAIACDLDHAACMACLLKRLSAFLEML